jgi:DGQHR domain-containing protein
VQGYFGKRIATYTTQIQPLQIKKVLGHDPRSKNWKTLPESTREIYQRIQRNTSKDRREGIAAYLEQRFGPRGSVGGFPAISIGLTQSTRFEPIAEKSAIGILHIEDEGERILLDGLGRVSGCLDLADESEEGAAIVKTIVLPVTFYVPAPNAEPLTLSDMGQLFMDFNFRVHPVPARIAIALDQSDIYISLANALAKEPFIAKHGGMEVKAASRGKKSTALVVQSVLLRAVRGACEGRDFQESNLASVPNRILTDDTYQAELQSIGGFFSEISSRMGGRWVDNDSLHLTAPGWQALGVIHHDMNHRDLNLSPAERTHIYDAISGVDWSRNNKEWIDEAGLGQWAVPKGGDKEQVVILGAGRNNTQAIIDFLRKRTGLQPKLNAKKQGVAA